jgi:RND superfamily putative drug exporter
MVAGAGATITLPALLKVLGPRIEKLSLRRRAPKALGEGGWHRIAVAVMKRPIPVATIGILILLFLGSPFLGVRMGLPDDRVLPPDAPGRVVSDEIRASFGGNEAFALSILLDDPAAASDSQGIEGLAAEISSFEEIARVDSARGSFVGGHRLFFDEALSNRFISGSATYLSAVLVPTVETQSPEAEAVVERIRGLATEYELLVTGASAELVDSKSIVLSRVPIALGWIAIVTFVALFLLFGSVIVPIKAVLLNLLSLTATFGAMVWVFQEGNLSSVLNFTATGSLVLGNIILMFCIAFGLSMDYEVFLLSRIKEEHDITGDNDGSVAVGLERTGRIVTAAAALISIVFIAMLSSGVSFIKLFGMGLSLAVIMDATLVRAFLVPAFMKMMGGANWWAPPALRRFHNRFGISEAPSSPAPARVSGGSR